MAKRTLKFLFSFFLLFIFLFYSTSGTTVGFAYDARGITGSPSIIETAVTSLKLNKVSPSQVKVLVTDCLVSDSLPNTGVSFDVYLNKTQFANLRSSRESSLSWLENHLRSCILKLNINSVTVSSSISSFSEENDLQLLLSSLRYTYSILTSLQLGKLVKLSVALPLSRLHNLNTRQKMNLDQILRFLRKSRSSLVIEDHIDVQLMSKGNVFAQSIIKKASLVTSILSHVNVPIVLSISSHKLPISTQLSALRTKILRSLEGRPQVTDKITGLLLGVSPDYNLYFSLSPRGELLENFEPRTARHDSFNPSTPITNPATTPSNLPLYSTPPTVVTVPANNPVTVAPPDPSSVPITVPSTTPVSSTPTNPVTSPAPPVNPGAQPVTNPVTTDPSPPGNNVPPTNPVTTDPSPPGTNVPPTNPVTANPSPPGNNVPPTNPITTNPSPPGNAVPPTNPVTTDPSPPGNSVPPTSPVTTDPSPPGNNVPPTNPVTTGPSSPGNNVPPTNPVMTPVTSPGVANAPTVAGQTWCVARSGVAESTLQSALNYACGIGGADCSKIQEGASCYDPDTLENHASYAFNNYFQRNPVATSCDFGGTAVLVNTNPSSGSCTFPSSATAAVPSTVPPATTSSTSGATGSSGSESPTSIMNASNPASAFPTINGSQSPAIITAPPSGSHALRPLFCIITVITSIGMRILLGV